MDSELEKVIKGLEYIENAAYGWNINGMTLGKPTEEIENICAAAIALLKAQEPRVMTLEEVLFNAGEVGFPCWIEDKITEEGFMLIPAVVISDEAYIEYSGNPYYEGAIYHHDYNKRLRCWTSRPTDEQREGVKWE